MTRRRDIGSVAAAAVLVMMLGASGAAATPPRHHRGHHRDIAPASPPRQTSFYPQNVDGGVAGNLSFNNQIRKFRDPLNANGGR